jgi:hypothetical protein
VSDEGLNPQSGDVTAVMARHELDLMRRANVVAVAEGTSEGQQCITVYVSRKVPLSELSEQDVLPRQLEGIRVEVVESGPIDAQST